MALALLALSVFMALRVALSFRGAGDENAVGGGGSPKPGGRFHGLPPAAGPWGGPGLGGGGGWGGRGGGGRVLKRERRFDGCRRMQGCGSCFVLASR